MLTLTLLHSEQPKLPRVLAVLSVIGFKDLLYSEQPKLYGVLAVLSVIGLKTHTYKKHTVRVVFSEVIFMSACCCASCHVQNQVVAGAVNKQKLQTN